MLGRLHWTVALGAAGAACSGGSTDDPPIDASAACAFADTVTVWIEGARPGPAGALEVAAAATVVDDPLALVLRTESGSVVRATYDAPGSDAQRFAPGERVWVEAAARGPFWVNHQLEVYDLDAMGGPGALRLAAWWGERRLQPVRGWTLEIEDGTCDATDTCGPAVGSSLRVTAPGGSQAVVAPGAFVDLEGHRVANGRSWRYLSSISCTDTPSTWSGVSVVRS